MAIVQSTQEQPTNFAGRALAWPNQFRSYIDDLRMEMRKVTWPNAKQVRGTTFVVIIAIFAFAAYFAVVDSLCNQTITRLFNTLTK